jgi:hypothetical protein
MKKAGREGFQNKKHKSQAAILEEIRGLIVSYYT